MKVEIGKEFYPDPKMKKLFFSYLILAIIPLLVLGIGISLYLFIINEWYILTYFSILYFIPIIVITVFISYWIPKYYKSIKFILTENEVRVERGVWWKTRHAIPYSRIMSVDTIQGPISRHFGIGTVDIYTAGYTGSAGGRGGPMARRAEASIIHISNFLEIREFILNIVKGRPLFSTTSYENLIREILEELREIKKLLSSKFS
ncbi:MAG: PH domain-containing protein [Candidatus Methanomethylicia archaeon]|nr:PH domain-containing protein [Candidatus Methanomethylicia archaeon]